MATKDNAIEKPAPSKSCYPTLTFYHKSRGPAIVEEGILLGRTFVPCRVEFTDSTYTLRLGRRDSPHFPTLRTGCADGAGTRPFNQRRGGQRVGIWFIRYPWGSLRKAALYQQGKVGRVVYYRPNGHFLRYVTYSEDGATRTEYDKSGRLVDALPHF